MTQAEHQEVLRLLKEAEKSLEKARKILNQNMEVELSHKVRIAVRACTHAFAAVGFVL